MLEAGPAEILVRAPFWVGASGEDAALHRPAEARGFALLQRVEVVEPFQEQEIGDLLNHLQRVGNPAGPEAIPDPVDLVAEFASQHSCV